MMRIMFTTAEVPLKSLRLDPYLLSSGFLEKILIDNWRLKALETV